MEVSGITDSCNNNLGSKIQIEEDVPIDGSQGEHGSIDNMIVRVWCESGAGWAPTHVPVTPQTTCRDVLDCCREPGDEPCLLLSVHPQHGGKNITTSRTDGEARAHDAADHLSCVATCSTPAENRVKSLVCCSACTRVQARALFR
ncbi:hypothetical protein MSG28_004644 [Choristoneura fumiferana]|uniref:Uncharacterized protein n=1 Tax=Choristoneura fumiferana TaxID=7141 RepID=A0ACC0K7T0_CHOFU|nr:hypothetical protein MSG28_004644 [Choristoneura fumiferana]